METEQIKVRLTSDPTVLKQLKKNRAMQKDDISEKYVIQYDSRAFEFRPGRSITVGKNVANGLIRSSGIIIGDHLTGDLRAALIPVGKFNLGIEDPADERKRATTCGVCGYDCETLTRLSRHLIKKHGDRKDLEQTTRGPAVPTDWEAQVDEKAKEYDDDDHAAADFENEGGAVPTESADGDDSSEE